MLVDDLPLFFVRGQVWNRARNLIQFYYKYGAFLCYRINNMMDV